MPKVQCALSGIAIKLFASRDVSVPPGLGKQQKAENETDLHHACEQKGGAAAAARPLTPSRLVWAVREGQSVHSVQRRCICGMACQRTQNLRHST